MPGIFGVVAKTREGEGRVGALARRMAGALRTRPWLRAELHRAEGFAGGRVHLGVLNPDRQPLRAPDGSLVWFDGEVYPGSDEPGRTPSAAEVVEWLDVHQDGRGLDPVDGCYALARWDAARRELVVALDRLGFRPLCWAETKHWIAYAPEPKALLAILDRTPPHDPIALRQFFGYDHMMGERTHWKAIRVLPPAALLRVREGEVRRDVWWDLGRIPVDPLPEEEALEAFGALWRRAIAQRRKPGTTPLLLSGGLDSRSVLAELLRQGASVHAVTFGHPVSPDVRIAARCARRAGVPHRILPLDEDSWWEAREAAIWQTDGQVNAWHLHAAVAGEALRRGTFHTFKHSTANALFGGSNLRPEDLGRWPQTFASQVARRYRSAFWPLEEILEETLEDCAPARLGPSATAFPLTQGQRRWILTGPQSLQAHCEVVNPGIGVDLLCLLLGGVPEERRMEARFYTRALVRHYPEWYSNVAWQKTGRGLDESLPVRVARGLGRRLRRAVGRPRRTRAFLDYARIVPESEPIRALPEGPLLLDEWMDGAAGRYLAAAAEGRSFAAGRTAREDEDGRRGPGEVGSPAGPGGSGADPRTLLAVLTLETYLRQVDGRPAWRPKRRAEEVAATPSAAVRLDSRTEPSA